MNREPLIVDMSKPQESVMLLPHAPILSSQSIGWNGLLFQEYHHPGHEVPEYVMRQHVIFIKNFFHEHLEYVRIEGQLPQTISILAGVDALFWCDDWCFRISADESNTCNDSRIC
jgi:hypothetical protein